MLSETDEKSAVANHLSPRTLHNYGLRIIPEARRHYGLLKDGVTSQPLMLLAHAVAETPDPEGLLILVDIENKHKQSLLGWRTIENVVTKHEPVENWSGAYNVIPVDASELRQKLFISGQSRAIDGGQTLPESLAALGEMGRRPLALRKIQPHARSPFGDLP